jgi:selenocysteine lyase/cysteine desulfurase
MPEVVMRVLALLLTAIAAAALTGCHFTAQGQNLQGVERFKVGDYNGAATHFQQALRTNPRSADPKKLADLLRIRLQDSGFVKVHDLGVEKCGIVTFNIPGLPSAEVQHKLAQDKINVSVSLEEYSRLDLSERKIEDLVRASVHYYNTEEEIDRFCVALERIIAQKYN